MDLFLPLKLQKQTCMIEFFWQHFQHYVQILISWDENKERIWKWCGWVEKASEELMICVPEPETLEGRNKVSERVENIGFHCVNWLPKGHRECQSLQCWEQCNRAYCFPPYNYSLKSVNKNTKEKEQCYNIWADSPA